jgi:PAS domain S-box-containing protein
VRIVATSKNQTIRVEDAENPDSLLYLDEAGAGQFVRVWDFIRLRHQAVAAIEMSFAASMSFAQRIAMLHRVAWMIRKVRASGTRRGRDQLQPMRVLIPIELYAFSMDDASLNEDTVRRLIDDSGLKIWVAGPDNENLYASTALLKYTGRSLSELRGMGWLQLVHPDDRELMLRSVRGAFPQRKILYVTYRFRHKSGRHYRMLDIALPRFDRTGNFRGYVGTMYLAKEGAVNDGLLAGEIG